MPKKAEVVKELAEKTEDFVLTVLLPIFFAFSGLRTQIGLLNRPILWILCAAVVAVAISGKYIGTYVAARVGGIEKREASALGWLMNTRGLTELIVLNIGLELKVISPLLFTMLVIMALVTTFMTSPLLEWTYPKKLIKLNDMDRELEDETNLDAATTYRILVPIANLSTQKGLMQLAVAIAGSRVQPAIVHPLSLIELEENYAFSSTPAEADRLIQERRSRMSELIQSLEPPETRKMVRPIIRTTKNVARETSQIAVLEQANLIVMGWHRSAFSSNRLGGRVGQILSTGPVDVAVFIQKGGERLETLLVPYSANIHDELGLEIALRLLINSEQRHLTILRVASGEQTHSELNYEYNTMMEQLPIALRDRTNLKIIETAEPIQAVVEASATVDLTIAGTSSAWGIQRQTLGRYTDEIAIQCHSSLLITRRYSQVTSHLASVLSATNADLTTDESGVAVS